MYGYIVETSSINKNENDTKFARSTEMRDLIGIS